MFQHFLKVVPTHRQFRTLDGKIINTHQYSTTQCERDTHPGNAISPVFAQPKKGGEAHEEEISPLEDTRYGDGSTSYRIQNPSDLNNPRKAGSRTVRIGFSSDRTKE
ncbi:hypothetical protein B0H16DRAFT_1734342 [Mycena metata]|uniref:Uncharacterized protein n=1 Tax=Mycena metata TaxID=1033252 RepID=A0AAD7MRT4_9AGAR|nr:hypothetical protein B0H16DRAFT_1734342 [Mycena metata]